MGRIIPHEWQRAFDHLVKREKANPPVQREDGTWVLPLGALIAPPGRVLAALPGKFERVAASTEESIDHRGEAVDVESDIEAWACDAERAIFRFVDHVEAGLTGSVSLFASADAYHQARSACVDEIGPAQDEDPN